MAFNIHTIFILRENILFIEEWISYHINLGVNKIHLYDNSKTSEGTFKEGINKYQIDFNSSTSHLSDDDCRNILSNILKKYKNHVIYVQWEPRDEHGNVWYGQKLSIMHYIKNLTSTDCWTAFIDIDEFIYCRDNLNAVLYNQEKEGVGAIILLQKKFDDRFNNLDIPTVEITKCIDGIDTVGWGPKNIIINKYFDPAGNCDWGIHSIPTKGCKVRYAGVEKMRINHYNVNSWQLEWMKEFYKSFEDFSLNGECDQLLNLSKKIRPGTN